MNWEIARAMTSTRSGSRCHHCGDGRLAYLDPFDRAHLEECTCADVTAGCSATGGRRGFRAGGGPVRGLEPGGVGGENGRSWQLWGSAARDPTMVIEERDAFDLVLVATALALVVGSSVEASNPVSVVGSVVGAVTSVDPIAYLVVVGVGGVLFMAYAMLYLPSQSRH